MQMSCNVVRACYTSRVAGEDLSLYVCNCNGIREREVRAVVAAGANRPAEVFRACDAKAQCARCVCDMRRIIDEQAETLRYAAE